LTELEVATRRPTTFEVWELRLAEVDDRCPHTGQINGLASEWVVRWFYTRDKSFFFSKLWAGMYTGGNNMGGRGKIKGKLKKK
jgi:hypothetical protein